MRQKNIDNAYARYEWLVEGIKHPDSISDRHVTHLSGQKKFSDLSIANKFSLLSLNTMKAAADLCLARVAPDGRGFAYLSKLRRDLYSRVKDRSEAKTVLGKKRRSKTLLKQAKEEKNQADVLNVVLTRAYGELLSNINSLLHDEEADGRTKARLENILNRHSQMYGVLLLPGVDEDKVGLSVIKGGRS